MATKQQASVADIVGEIGIVRIERVRLQDAGQIILEPLQASQHKGPLRERRAMVRPQPVAQVKLNEGFVQSPQLVKKDGTPACGLQMTGV